MLGPNSLHWASKLLKTHYREFHSPFGIDGLAKETNGGKTLSILAVHTQQRRQGRFRSFMEEAKKEYTEIFVWEISNPILENALKRYGFSHTSHTEWDSFNQRNETIQGMVWKKKTPS